MRPCLAPGSHIAYFISLIYVRKKLTHPTLFAQISRRRNRGGANDGEEPMPAEVVGPSLCRFRVPRWGPSSQPCCEAGKLCYSLRRAQPVVKREPVCHCRPPSRFWVRWAPGGSKLGSGFPTFIEKSGVGSMSWRIGYCVKIPNFRRPLEVCRARS